MLYRMDAPRETPQEPLAYIRTFGYFDVFVGEKPIAFRNEKSKELFALLAARKRATPREYAFSFLLNNPLCFCGMWSSNLYCKRIGDYFFAKAFIRQ